MNTITIPSLISPDPTHQKQLSNLLSNFQTSDQGLDTCLAHLKNEFLPKNDELFWLMVLDNQVKARYCNSNNNNVSSDVRVTIRSVLLGLVKLHTNSDFQLQLASTCNNGNISTNQAFFSSKESASGKPLDDLSEASLVSPILTKISVILVRIFMNEYLSNAWASFFQDVWGLGNFDIYLRVLEQIDTEVVDRTFESLKSTQEAQQAQSIKDQMRLTDVPNIIQNFQLLLVEAGNNQSATKLIDKVLIILSKYVAWIDIDLIVTNQTLSNLLLNFLNDNSKRENTCKVFTAMVNKGMLPETKLQFIKHLYSTLDSKFQPFISNFENLEEDDVNYVVNIAELHSGILTVLGTAFTASPLPLPEVISLLDETFIPLAIKLLINEWNDIGENIIPGLKAYIELAKSRKSNQTSNPGVLPVSDTILNNLLQAVIRKMRYDDDYDFDDLDDEEETDLGLFMRDLRTIYENVGLLNSEVVLADISNKISQIGDLENNDLELVLRMVGQLGDAIPSVIDLKNSTDYGPAFIVGIITKIIELDLVRPSDHVGVHCEYYSVLIRYERILLCNDKQLVIRILPKILTTLLDERGIMHKKSVQARKYCCVAFSRIIRTSLGNSATLHFLTENNAGEQILTAVCGAMESGQEFFDSDDRLNLFEVAGLAASRITNNPETWCRKLVQPCLDQFKVKITNALSRLDVASYVEEQLESANHYINCITRTSKAFTAKFSMESKNCEQMFLDSLTVFLETLKLTEKIQSVIRPNIKQFIHKMVLCLNKHIDSIIVPALLEAFSACIENENVSEKMLIDVVPILAQIIQKHTKDDKVHNFCWPMLARACFQIWDSRSNVNDEEILNDCKYIRRHCYNIIMIAIQNKDWLGKLETEGDVQQFLAFTLDGVSTSKYCDPQTIRNAIFTFNWLSKEWLSKSSEILEYFVVTCCPVVMMFPIHPDSKNFALQDPQLGLAIKELATFVKFLYKNIGNQFLEFLASEVLKKKMGLSDDEVQHFCEAIEQRQSKQWVQYVRNFYGPRMLR